MHEHIRLPGKTDQAILMIHGLTATPLSVLPIANYFNQVGINVSIPLLPGHGTNPADLLDVGWQDWLQVVENEFQELKKQYSKVHVVGISMGGNIGLCLSAKYQNDTEKIVSIGTPIFLQNQLYIKSALPIYSLFKDYHKKRIGPGELSYFKHTGTYTVWPYQSIRELLKIIEQTKSILPLIKSKILVLYSKQDPLVRADSAEFIFDQLTIPSTHRTEIALEEKSHVLLNKEVAEQIIHFLRAP